MGLLTPAIDTDPAPAAPAEETPAVEVSDVTDRDLGVVDFAKKTVFLDARLADFPTTE